VMRMRKRLMTVLAHAFLVVCLLVSVVPAFMLLAVSFKPTAIFISPPEILSLEGFGFGNYVRAFQLGDFVHHLRNSLFIAVSATVLTLVVCTTMAFGLSKLSPRVRSALTFLILSTRFVPYVVLALPFFLFFLTLGISGTRPGLLLAHLAMQVPFAVWLLVEFFDGVPREIEEAAIVDGCSPLRVYWNVSLPIVISGVSACAILVFILSWNEYLFAVFISGYEAQPLTVGITRFLGAMDTGTQYGVIAAYGSLIVLPVILLTLVLNRYIVSGLTAGAVKG